MTTPDLELPWPIPETQTPTLKERRGTPSSKRSPYGRRRGVANRQSSEREAHLLSVQRHIRAAGRPSHEAAPPFKILEKVGKTTSTQDKNAFLSTRWLKKNSGCSQGKDADQLQPASIDQSVYTSAAKRNRHQIQHYRSLTAVVDRQRLT